MKRFLSVIAVILLFSMQASAAPVYFDDVNNNDLFEVISIITTNEEWNGMTAQMAEIEKKEYNDGIKKVVTPVDEWQSKSYLCNANGAIIFNPGEKEDDSNYNYFYNLGYIVECYGEYNINENAYRYNTTVKNIFTGEEYTSDKIGIWALLNDGTMLAQSGHTDYLVKIKKPAIPTVHLNGEKIYFDQIPVIENGRTLVPLRAIFEALGATVEWDGETQTVKATKGDTTVSLTIENTIATKNSEEITLDVPAKIINGRTMVPVRFIADCFGVDVQWNGETQQVLLASK